MHKHLSPNTARAVRMYKQLSFFAVAWAASWLPVSRHTCAA